MLFEVTAVTGSGQLGDPVGVRLIAQSCNRGNSVARTGRMSPQLVDVGCSIPKPSADTTIRTLSLSLEKPSLEQ